MRMKKTLNQPVNCWRVSNLLSWPMNGRRSDIISDVAAASNTQNEPSITVIMSALSIHWLFFVLPEPHHLQYPSQLSSECAPIPVELKLLSVVIQAAGNVSGKTLTAHSHPTAAKAIRMRCQLSTRLACARSVVAQSTAVLCPSALSA